MPLQCYRVVVFPKCCRRFRWHWHGGGGLEGLWTHCLSLHGIDDANEDLVQLFCAVFKHSPRNVVWSSSLVVIDLGQGLRHISRGKTEDLVAGLWGGFRAVSFMAVFLSLWPFDDF